MRVSNKDGRRLLAALSGVMLGMLVAPASARAPELAMLDGLAPGSWDVHIRSENSHNNVCVRTGRELIQIRHKQASCSRAVVEDQANRVTVEYNCAGAGYGRTTIRRESAQLVQIDSQGIQGGLPFHFDAEARRVGSC